MPDPQPNEAYCKECGTLFTGRGRPRKSDAGNVLAEVAASMSGALPEPDIGPKDSDAAPIPYKLAGRGEPPMDVTPLPAVPPTWCRMAGRRMSQAFVMIVEGGCRRFAKREAAEPEEEDTKELGIALGEQLAIWFPDSDMTPATKCMIAAASVTATMVVGSKPIKPPARLASIPQQTPVAAPTEETPTAFESPAPINVTIPRGLF